MRPLETGPLRVGKLSPDLLRGLVLERRGTRRPETLIGARLGVDAAAIDLGPGQVCVLTVDPITTAGQGAGWLAVHVACNDLAVMGATPVGVLATLLLPAGVMSAALDTLTAEIDAAARALEVEVLGGHTEVASGVSALLVVMTGVGKASRAELRTAADARPGDALVLTKAAGLEGSAILAADFAAALAGVDEDVLATARGYAAEVSVVPEARLAVRLGARAMHDPTEAGVVGALWELGEAAGCGWRVDVGRVPVRAPTRAICAALGVDPLRLISSGALLVAGPDGAGLVEGLAAGGIAAVEIGVLTADPGERMLLHADGHAERVRGLDRDELYRLAEERAARGG